MTVRLISVHRVPYEKGLIEKGKTSYLLEYTPIDKAGKSILVGVASHASLSVALINMHVYVFLQ